MVLIGAHTSDCLTEEYQLGAWVDSRTYLYAVAKEIPLTVVTSRYLPLQGLSNTTGNHLPWLGVKRRAANLPRQYE